MRRLKMILLPPILFFFFAPLGAAEFGNCFVATKRLSTSLDTSKKKLSYRFTCQEDMDLSAAAIYCLKAENPPSYLISVQKDEQGFPSGTPLSTSHFVPLQKSWSTIPLASVPLLKGKIYHLVLEQDILRGGGHPVGRCDASHYAAFLYTDVLNHLHPRDGSPDPATNVIAMDEKGWKEINREPVYALYGTGNKLQGNPYDDPGVCAVYGNNGSKEKTKHVLQGESLHFHCGFASSTFAIRVRKQGHPTDPLNYSILKHFFQIHKTTPIYSALALTPDQVSSEFQWVTIGFGDRSKSNFSPECWFLVFETDAGHASNNGYGCDDCYLISDVGNSGGLPEAADLTFDNGPHLSREVYSLDGGDPFHWIDDFERDANVFAIGPACPPPLERTFEAMPTPEPLDFGMEGQVP